MKVTLSRQITVHRFAIFAEMAWMERRPELGIICRKALENGRRLSSETIAAVLPGLSAHGAANIIAWCKTLDICDSHGILKKVGEDVAQSDDAPVPEQGVYGVWVAQHELFGARILAAERLASRREQRLEDIRDLPLIPDTGKVFRSVLDPKDRFILRKLPTNNGNIGCHPLETKAVCHLRWTLDFTGGRNQWRLDGALDGPHNAGKAMMWPMKHEGESENLDLWELARIWGMNELQQAGTWNSANRRLAVPYASLSEQESETFRKTISVPRVEVPGKGSFTDVRIEDVPIGPMNANDARSWALARFDRNVAKKVAYRSRAQVKASFLDLVQKTPLEAFGPTLPSHQNLVEAYEKPRNIFWSFAAPVDLSPLPVSQDELTVQQLPGSGGGR